MSEFIGVFFFFLGNLDASCYNPFGAGLEWLQVLAQLRFLVVSETSVESRHAKVSLELHKHAVGPCRVSLSNRYPILQQWLATGFGTMAEFLNHFDKARSCKQVVSMLGLERHPLIWQQHLRSSDLRPRLVSILYHCSLDDVYASQKQLANEAQQGKLRDQTRKAPGTLGGLRRPRTFQDVEMALLHAHVPRRMLAGLYYSCPQDVVHLASLGSSYSQSMQESSFLSSGDIEAETFVMDGSDTVRQQPGLIFFQLLLKNPSGKKVLTVHNNTPAHSVLVSLHSSMACSDKFVVQMQAQASSSFPDPAFFPAWMA